MANVDTLAERRRRSCTHGATALAIVAAAALHSFSNVARGVSPGSTSAGSASASAAPSASASAAPWLGETGDTRAGLDPFPSTGRYLSYGFAFHSEGLLTPGNICPKGANEECILGSGGGISFSGALRAQLYSLGVVYEASFHDSNNIYQRGVLQQLRGEWRFRPRGLDITDAIHPFIGAGGGVAGYGDNWTIATFGGSGHAMVGGEWDLGVKVSVHLAFAYRAIYFQGFSDPSRQERPPGLVHFLGLQLGIELHEPF
jgi:hypothetical protein